MDLIWWIWGREKSLPLACIGPQVQILAQCDKHGNSNRDVLAAHRIQKAFRRHIVSDSNTSDGPNRLHSDAFELER